MGHCPECGAEVDPRDLKARDNTFREEPDEAQTSLADLAEHEDVTVEGPDDPSVWERVQVDYRVDESISIDVVESRPEPGGVINPHDPHEW